MKMKTMHTTLFFLVIQIALTPAVLAAGNDCTTPQPPLQEAACLKIAAETGYQTHPGLAKNATTSIKKGDSYYRRKQYLKAHKQYDLAKLNSPTAYATLRTADALFAALASTTRFDATNGAAGAQCYRASDYLATVDAELPGLYETGIELHKILSAGPAVPPAMIHEAKRKMGCLRALADRYRPTRTGCVDLPALRTCVFAGPDALADSEK